ncbi:2'-5'-oligoadenylate synthase 2-like [Elgaria multicarinata webbii]|uniref:2'-5'-oligoadenylate synthase 2-like n=1 Tax=Elgaria multicarinata webbii TaxID=159646 RepID=UPI002FCCE2ED
MAEGFRTVLWLLQQHRQLCIFWTLNYDFQDKTLKGYLQGQLRKSRPVLLDPADPTRNLGEGSRWDLLAKEAEGCSQQRCCKNVSGSPVAHWDVPLQVPWADKWFYCTIL